MGQLLTTRASIVAHCRKQVLDSETIFCQNKAQTTKAIREAKAHCMTDSRHGGYMCNSYQGGRGNLCRSHLHSTTIAQWQYAGHRKGGHWGGRERLPIFPNCLQGGTAGLSPEAHGVLMYTLQLLMGNMSLATLLAISPSHPPQWGHLPLQLPIQLHQWYPCPPQEPNSHAICPTKRWPHHSQ